MIVLRRDHVERAVIVQPELDNRVGDLYVLTGGCECGRPFVMNDCFFHKAVSPKLTRFFRVISPVAGPQPQRKAKP